MDSFSNGPYGYGFRVWLSQAPLLKKKPSEYMTDGRIYYHAELWENMLPYVIERIGEDLITLRKRLSARAGSCGGDQEV